MREFDFPVEISRPAPPRCDCFCRGRCPEPFRVGDSGTSVMTWQCPRDAVYELVWEDDDGDGEFPSVMCVPCTAERRKHTSVYETLVSVKSL